MSTPLIVHNVQAHQYYAPSFQPKSKAEEQYLKESNFFRCKTDFTFLKYITRDKANEKMNLKTVKNLEKLLESNVNSNQNYMHYQNERPGSTGSFDKDGDIDSVKLQAYEKKLQSTKSTVWTSILSFTPEYSDKYMRNKQQAFDTITSTINQLFKKCGLDPDNMEWTCAYHTNTDNRHCHLVFWEKEKLKLNKYGVPIYSHWKLPKGAIESFKSDIAYFHKNEPLTYLSLRDNIKDNIISLVKNDHSTILANLDSKLKGIKSYQYARISRENQFIINNAVDKLINSNSILKSSYNNYFQSLLKTQKSILTNCKEVNVLPTQEQKQFMSSRIAEFYNRCGNSVLQQLKEYRLIIQNSKEEKKKIREDAQKKLPKKSSANSRRIIYKTSVSTRGKNSRIASLMKRLFVILASDVSREHDSLEDSWNKRKREDNNEKDWKD